MSAQSNFQDVGHFHEKFGLDCGSHQGFRPRPVTNELVLFRLKFLEEELREITEAIQTVELPDGTKQAVHIDHVKLADGLIDLVYVTLGFAQVMGYPWQPLWNEVQRANMTKERCLRAGDSTRGSTYDVIKPAGWMPPKIAEILRRYGWNV